MSRPRCGPDKGLIVKWICKDIVVIKRDGAAKGFKIYNELLHSTVKSVSTATKTSYNASVTSIQTFIELNKTATLRPLLIDMVHHYPSFFSIPLPATHHHLVHQNVHQNVHAVERSELDQ